MTYKRPYQYAVLVGCVWLIFGAFFDVYAHFRGLVDTSFFTPYHLIMYSGFGVLMLTHIYPALREGLNSVSPAYRTSILGCLIFLGGGLADMVWHTLLGIEKDLVANFSPPHLILAVGFIMILSGPFRAFLNSEEGYHPDQTWRSAGVAIASLAFCLAIVSGLLLYLSPYSPPFASSRFTQYVALFDGVPKKIWGLSSFAIVAGQAAFMLQTAFIVGTTCLMSWRYKLPRGAYTFIFGLQAALMSLLWLETRLILVGVLTGVVCDVLSAKSLLRNPVSTSFVIGCAFPGIMMAILALTGGVWWEWAVIGGCILICGVEGTVLSAGLRHSPTMRNIGLMPPQAT